MKIPKDIIERNSLPLSGAVCKEDGAEKVLVVADGRLIVACPVCGKGIDITRFPIITGICLLGPISDKVFIEIDVDDTIKLWTRNNRKLHRKLIRMIDESENPRFMEELKRVEEGGGILF